MKPMSMTVLLLGTLCNAPVFLAQTKPSTNVPNANRDLTMTAMGNGKIFGHKAGFRTYETQDLTKAVVWYTTFRTEQEAKGATKQSLKEQKITSEELIRDANGRVIGDRVTETPQDEKNGFTVVQTQGLSCWIIQSSSLATAMRVAGLIELPQGKN